MKTYAPTPTSTRLAALALSALVVAAFAGTLERDSGRVERFARIAANSAAVASATAPAQQRMAWHDDFASRA